MAITPETKYVPYSILRKSDGTDVTFPPGESILLRPTEGREFAKARELDTPPAALTKSVVAATTQLELYGD